MCLGWREKLLDREEKEILILRPYLMDWLWHFPATWTFVNLFGDGEISTLPAGWFICLCLKSQETLEWRGNRQKVTGWVGGGCAASALLLPMKNYSNQATDVPPASNISSAQIPLTPQGQVAVFPTQQLLPLRPLCLRFSPRNVFISPPSNSRIPEGNNKTAIARKKAPFCI